MTLYTNTTQATRVFPDLPLTLAPGETGDFPDAFLLGTDPELLGLTVAAKKATAKTLDNAPPEVAAPPAPEPAASTADLATNQPTEG